MNDQNRQDAHRDINHIFKDLLPTQGMPERPEQIALSHRMLEAMQDGGIALCGAGTGIGKTYAYLVAGTVFHSLRPSRPVLISTSSIALQKAVRDEYLPFLSVVLAADSMIAEPIQAVIRKGKSHYVCDQRLERRLGQLDLRKKNWRAGNALLSLREKLDLDEAPRLSGYDRERVCVPKVCDCQLVAANDISLASASRQKLAHSVAAPLPAKSYDFAGTPKCCRYRAFLDNWRWQPILLSNLQPQPPAGRRHSSGHRPSAHPAGQPRHYHR